MAVKLGKVLGTGSYADVRIGTLGDGRDFAVKLLDAQFPSEIDIYARLRHNNLVPGKIIYRSRRGQLSVLMDIYKKLNLSHFRKTGDIRDVLGVIHQVLDGLAFLHSCNYLHLDIKSPNLLIDEKGGVRINDFGSCLFMETESKELEFAWVSPAFRPPELTGKKKKRFYYSRTTDTWSVGVLLIELLNEDFLDHFGDGYPPNRKWLLSHFDRFNLDATLRDQVHHLIRALFHTEYRIDREKGERRWTPEEVLSLPIWQMLGFTRSCGKTVDDTWATFDPSHNEEVIAVNSKVVNAIQSATWTVNRITVDTWLTSQALFLRTFGRVKMQTEMLRITTLYLVCGMAENGIDVNAFCLAFNLDFDELQRNATRIMKVVGGCLRSTSLDRMFMLHSAELRPALTDFLLECQPDVFVKSVQQQHVGISLIQGGQRQRYSPL